MYDAARPANNIHRENGIEMGNGNVSPASGGIVGRSSMTQNQFNQDSNDDFPSDIEKGNRNGSNAARQIPNYR